MNTNKAAGPTAPGPLYKYSQRIVLRVVAGQIVVALAITLALGVILGAHFGYSVLVGAGIGIVPNYYFAVRVFNRSASLSPEQLLRGIYVGESIKVVFTLALFVLTLLLLDVTLWAVALGYFATVLVNWVAVLVVDLGESPRTSG